MEKGAITTEQGFYKSIMRFGEEKNSPAKGGYLLLEQDISSFDPKK